MVTRDPEATRQKILTAAFEEIHRNGFRSASLDQILKKTGLTKGAFYHHFPNKNALGYAVVDEVIRQLVLDEWVLPLEGSDDPLEALRARFESIPHENVDIACTIGCPLNNLAQEMSPIDETFREKLEAVYGLWKQKITEAFLRGQGAGTVRSDIDPHQCAAFIIASIEGALGMCKNARDPWVLESCLAGLTQYLESLRAPVPAVTS